MKSKPVWLHGGEPDEVADRADKQARSELDAELCSEHFGRFEPALVDTPQRPGRDFADARTRALRTLLDLAEQEEEVRMEAVEDDELMAEIAAAYDLEFRDDFERALFAESIKAERIWKKESVESRSKIRKSARDSQPLI